MFLCFSVQNYVFGKGVKNSILEEKIEQCKESSALSWQAEESERGEEAHPRVQPD